MEFLSVKFWVSTINGRGNSFNIKELHHRPWKFLNVWIELLLIKVPQQAKACSKSLKKESFRNVIRVSLCYIFSQLGLCSAKWVYFYYQVFQMWLLIQRVDGSVGRWVSGRWSVVWLFPWSVDLVKPKKKHVWGKDSAHALWSRFILLL